MARLTALSVFEIAMAGAAIEYTAAGTPSELRGAAAAALSAVHRLMTDTGMQAHIGPVVAMAFALATLDAGTALPLVTAEQRCSKRPKVPDVVWLQRAVVAAALEQRFRNTRALPRAAADVARWLAGSEVVGKLKSPASSIIKWRETISARRSNEEPKQLYAHYTKPPAGAGGQFVVPLPDADALLRELKIYGVGKTL